MNTTTTALTNQQVAHIVHEANRAYQYVTGDPAPAPPWADAPEWQQESALAGIAAVRKGTTDEEQHAAWSAHKRADGWTYGPVKDAAAKTHPCLVDYADLPEMERKKDTLFRAVVTALTA